MDFSKELLFSFSALGVCNGLVLAMYFFFFARPKHISHVFLGGLLFFLSVRIGKSVFYYFNYELAGTFVQIGLTACWLLGPFLYFYVKYATSKVTLKQPFWVYHLVGLALVALLVNIKYPWEEFRMLWQHYFIFAIHIQWFLYLSISGRILWNTFKDPNNNRNVSFKFWVFSIYSGNVIIWLAYNLSPYTSYIIGALTFTLIFYLLLVLILLSKKRKSLLLLYPPKYGDVQIEDIEAKRIIDDFTNILEKDKFFKDPTISLQSIAKKIGVQPSRLSQVLNMNMNKSFPTILGEYRIEEAKKMIKKNPEYSIESIGYDCGYNSKSSFYSVFKKNTGITPAGYKNSLNR
ncbi:helix-turn-helix domain-containing protein [Aquimarina sp. D1M17]|uniref:helix-turn-helix domain-containing protein n=1 Tax=Aquimarina acroporae TaxID=2937283 RepID=UPI0020C064AC|nr:helix-turn-helix domain-containing protein [Aquimarina acroporae]MCK8520729.1 helix-turn-helix domain-containing protein [Aquimarina acroporae]